MDCRYAPVHLVYGALGPSIPLTKLQLYPSAMLELLWISCLGFLCFWGPIHEIPAATKDMEEVSSLGPRFKGLFACFILHSLG